MKTLRRPPVWLPVTYLALIAAGTALLAAPGATQTTQRDLKFYLVRHIWNSAFDAVSATCGVGMLTRDFDDGFTDRGRRILTGLGAIGAVLYLLAFAQVARKLRGLLPVLSMPRPWLILLAFLGMQVLLCAVFIGVRSSPTLSGTGDAALQAIAAFASLGWRHGPETTVSTLISIVIGLIGAIGWTGWMVVFWPLFRRHIELDKLPARAATYVLFVAICGGLLALFELPRGFGVQAAPPGVNGPLPPTNPLSRGFLLAGAAAGAGMPADKLDEGGVSEASKLLLGAIVLAGGMSGSPAGGLSWSVVIFGLSLPLLAILGRTMRRPDLGTDRLARACGTCVIAMLALAFLVTLSLLFNEARVASQFQPPPTLGDAWLDACSIVGGANLTTGVVSTLTDPNLSGGMFRSVDLFPYGMTWIALAMLAGRVLPLLVLWRCGDAGECGGSDPGAGGVETAAE